MAKFRCGAGHTLSGSPVSWCGGEGSWSPPWSSISCVAACVYPGALIHGHISPVLFYYRLGRTVQYSCLEVSRQLDTLTLMSSLRASDLSASRC